MPLKPPHYELPQSPYPNWNPYNGANQRTIKSVLRSREKATKEGVPLFFYLRNYYDNFEDFDNGYMDTNMKILMHKDCVIEFYVNSMTDQKNLALRVSSRYDVITEKSMHKMNGNRIYASNIGNKSIIMAKSRPLVSPVPDSGDDINFNLELYQGKDSSDGEYWLPFTLDPEIINPRPPGSLLRYDANINVAADATPAELADFDVEVYKIRDTRLS
jgi:hypothetical protein